MILSHLKTPISVFSLEELGIDNEKYINQTKDYFYDLEWDMYLFKQNQIEFLIENLPIKLPEIASYNSIYLEYYSGRASANTLAPLIALLNEEQKNKFNKIKPTRRRSIAQFKIRKQGDEINPDRYHANSFNQQEAKSNNYDWRKYNRIFAQANESVITDDLNNIIKSLSKKIFATNPGISIMDLVIHFTQIVATGNRQASNSPEGIHQDGMDYIVSALVIERKNVYGGKSIVFGQDKQSKIFETTLMPGYGIMQPDKNTDLWHLVEPIYAKDYNEQAFRSTIGFDFSLT